MMRRVKERCVWIAHVEEHDSHGLGAAAVVARHFHSRRFNYRFTSFSRDRRATLHLQRECAFQDVDGHGEAVCMERSRVAGLEGCCEDSHLLSLALGHALHDLSQERWRGFATLFSCAIDVELMTKATNAAVIIIELRMCMFSFCSET